MQHAGDMLLLFGRRTHPAVGRRRRHHPPLVCAEPKSGLTPPTCAPGLGSPQPPNSALCRAYTIVTYPKMSVTETFLLQPPHNGQHGLLPSSTHCAQNTCSVRVLFVCSFVCFRFDSPLIPPKRLSGRAETAVVSAAFSRNGKLVRPTRACCGHTVLAAVRVACPRQVPCPKGLALPAAHCRCSQRRWMGPSGCGTSRQPHLC